MKSGSTSKTRNARDERMADNLIDSINPGLFDSSGIGYQLRDTYNAWVRTSQGMFGRLGITFPMWLLLVRLWQEEGLTQKELIDHAALMQSSTSSVLNKLTRLGLIRMRISDSDGRKATYFLTVKGKGVVEQLAPAAIELRKIALHKFTPKEMVLLRQMLSRIKNNLLGSNGDSSKRKRPSATRTA